jgi:hypothetical protein
MDLGADRSPATAADDIDAREAFALLGHDIRLEILLALLEDWLAAYTEPKSYAELMDAVGMEDSGKFNYHLDKLRGVYVRQVEDGYVPTASATALYRTVLAHRPTDSVETDRRLSTAACPACGADPELRYDRGFLTVDCSDCAEWEGFTYPFPQTGFERHDDEQLLDAVRERVRHEVGLARTGQCPACAGPTTIDLRLDDIEDDGWVRLACDSCTFVVGVDPLTALLTDDRVGSALREVGLDPLAQDWERPDSEPTVQSRDPPRVAVTVVGPAGTATVTVDETLAPAEIALE